MKGGEGFGRRPRGVMPRKPREEVAGGIHHVYARGNNKALLFFPCRKADVERVVIATRPLEWVTLPNVALRPAKKVEQSANRGEPAAR